LTQSHDVVVINLATLASADRPAAARDALVRLASLRGTTGRPHWILVEKAHLALPVELTPEGPLGDPTGLVLVTVHPERVAPAILQRITLALAVGDRPSAALNDFAAAAGLAAPIPAAAAKLAPGSALAWDLSEGRAPEPVEIGGAKDSRRSNAA
jgi:hypothetical protein